MKKLSLMLAALSMVASVSAQTVAESKTFDNWYIGINGGVATKTTQNSWLKNLNPNAGVRIGRYFTPVFGLALESNAYFSNKPFESNGTVVRFINTSLLGTTNLTNWIAGYKGEPRAFEVSAVYGLGWGHTFNSHKLANSNVATSKLALDFAFNFGKNKEWQVYIEPSIVYALNGSVDSYKGWNEVTVGTTKISTPASTPFYGNEKVQYNINRSMVQLNAGLIYKFKNSNGTHNFTIVTPRDQAEIDALNAQINELRNRKPEVITKEIVKEVPAVKEFTVSDLVFVTFAQGKSVLTKEAKAALGNIKEGVHVQVVGTASPEGSAEINQKISQNRANVVADYLRGRGVIVDEATGKGVQGTTSNRLAVVYVK